MSQTPRTFPFNPELDLMFERVVDVPRSLVWRAWTEPEHLMKWFCPVPWKTTECKIDLRPGGRFYSVMQGPNGERQASEGCYLEVILNERLTWTDGLTEGFRPASSGFLTGSIRLEDAPGGETKYTAIALHKNAEDRKQHEEMGFKEGWGTALDQLVEMVKKDLLKK